jgi:ER-bound oxygenase mpaB/B'/Rubber oxygenase, catalytic domain
MMHFNASNAAETRKHEGIPQAHMTLAQFGFMGFAIIKPHMLGIRHDNREDREAFVHLWAVIGYMLDIKEEFNMCLHSLEVVEM